MSETSRLEQEYANSAKLAEASARAKSGITLTPEEKAKIAEVAKLWDEAYQKLHGKSVGLQEKALELAGFFDEVNRLLFEYAADANHYRIIATQSKTTEELMQNLLHNVQLARREDLATMIRYLDKVSQQIGDLVAKYEAELEKQAAHRDAEKETLDRLNNVLQHYE